MKRRIYQSLIAFLMVFTICYLVLGIFLNDDNSFVLSLTISIYFGLSFFSIHGEKFKNIRHAAIFTIIYAFVTIAILMILKKIFNDPEWFEGSLICGLSFTGGYFFGKIIPNIKIPNRNKDI